MATVAQDQLNVVWSALNAPLKSCRSSPYERILREIAQSG